MNFSKSLVIALASLPLFSQSAYLPVSQLEKTLQDIRSEARFLNSNNCQTQLQSMNQVFSDWMPEAAEKAVVETQGAQLLKTFFDTRLALHEQIGALPDSCVSQMRDLFRNLRASEDILGVMYYKDVQVSATSLDYSKQAVPLVEASQYRPYFLNPAYSQFEFKKGDLMITKGISEISSTISSIPKQPSLFSHIAYVYQDPQTGHIGTIESYIGKGVDFYTLKEALINENARITVIRAKDQELTVKGHDYIVNRVKTAFAQNRRIPYDYKMDFTNNSALSCEEIAYDAYYTASNGQFSIPSNFSEIDLKDQKIIKGSGLHQGPAMLPADMELDPRFEIVLDWTDYRIMRDNWRKDAIQSEVLRWINEEQYILANSPKATLGKILWKTRNIAFLWPISARIMGVSTDYEKEVPSEGVALLVNFKTIGPAIMKHLEAADRKFFQEKGRWMSRKELRTQVNEIRKKDAELYKLKRKSDFHTFFRPY